MADLPQFLADAVLIGSLYALIALGYTMVYGVLKFINFAHSDIVVVGAWTSVLASSYLLPQLGIVPGNSPWWAVLMVMLTSIAVCASFGFVIERLAYKPIRKAPRLNALITAIGVSLLLQSAGQLQFNIYAPPAAVVASGVIAERVELRKLKLSEDIKTDPAGQFVIRFTNAAGQTRDAEMPSVPTTISAGSILELKAVGLPASYAGGRFELRRTALPLQLPFGAKPRSMPQGFVSKQPVYQTTFTSQVKASDGTTISVAKPFQITMLDLTIVGTTLCVLVVLQFVVFGSRLGTAMRAVSYNMDTAALMGIPVDRIVSITFVIGTAMAAVAGFLYSIKYAPMQQPAHQAWTILGLKAFIAAVVGGIGNVRGAAVGGFLIAGLEKTAEFAGLLTNQNWVSGIVDVFVFALLIVVLLVKPSGIFGSTVREKV